MPAGSRLPTRDRLAHSDTMIAYVGISTKLISGVGRAHARHKCPQLGLVERARRAHP